MGDQLENTEPLFGIQIPEPPSNAELPSGLELDANLIPQVVVEKFGLNLQGIIDEFNRECSLFVPLDGGIVPLVLGLNQLVSNGVNLENISVHYNNGVHYRNGSFPSNTNVIVIDEFLDTGKTARELETLLVSNDNYVRVLPLVTRNMLATDLDVPQINHDEWLLCGFGMNSGGLLRDNLYTDLSNNPYNAAQLYAGLTMLERISGYAAYIKNNQELQELNANRGFISNYMKFLGSVSIFPVQSPVRQLLKDLALLDLSAHSPHVKAALKTNTVQEFHRQYLAPLWAA